MLAQIECENAEWSTDRIGSSGDIGIYQANPTYFPQARNPEWQNDPTRQINEYVEMWQVRQDKYGDNINRVLLHHNRPKSAIDGEADFKGYVDRIITKCLPRFI